jgi:hypothetical protein
MYSWYKESQVCYAYLADIRRGETLQDDLRGSNWFTRGWTLQELLAPSSVVFFDTNWNDVGTKGSLVDIISEITGIDDFVNFEGACVAKKMSWVAKRETTRVEDMAYCLLGLFNVNMPPLYGEGERSFMRLQLEILRTSDDESIFAWDTEYDSWDHEGSVDTLQNLNSGLLATTPKYFMNLGSIRPLKRTDRGNDLFSGDVQPFSMTNKGLHISLVLIQARRSDESLFLAPLKCLRARKNGEGDLIPTVQLRKSVEGVEIYTRVATFWCQSGRIENLVMLNYISLKRRSSNRFSHKYIYVNKGPSYQLKRSLTIKGWEFFVKLSSLKDHGFAISQYDQLELELNPEDSVDETRLVIKCVHGIVAGLQFVNGTGETIVLAIIVENGYAPSLLILTPDSNEKLENITSSLFDLCIGTTSIGSVNGSTSNVSSVDAACTMTHTALPGSENTGEIESYVPHQRPPLDRVSQRLRNGKSISACLRHVAADGGHQQFWIDIVIDVQDALRWPAPEWTKSLLLSMAMKNMKGEKQFSGAKTAESTKEHRRRRRTAPVSTTQHAVSEKRREKGGRFARDDRSRSRGRKRDDRIMEMPNRPFYRREVSRDYMQPESQEYSQGTGKERNRERRTYHSSGRSGSKVRDEREWTREKRVSKNGRAIRRKNEW